MQKELWAVRKSDGYAFRKQDGMSFPADKFDIVESAGNPQFDKANRAAEEAARAEAEARAAAEREAAAKAEAEARAAAEKAKGQSGGKQ